MGHKNPKAKGSEWERKVCKRLSLWVSNMTREDIFWRSAMSGGRATFQTRKDRGSEEKFAGQAGDISAISIEGMPLIDKFYLECKNLADMKLDGIIYGATGELRKYWYEPLENSKKYGKLPLVIAKENFRNPIVLTTHEGRTFLEMSKKEEALFPLYAVFPKEGIYIFSFRDMLADVDYKKLCKLIVK